MRTVLGLAIAMLSDPTNRTTTWLGITVLLPFLALSQSAWQWQNPLPQGNNLTIVQSLDTQTAYAAGEHGTFMTTTNGGLQWEVGHFPLAITPHKMQFLNPLSGWIGGRFGTAVYLFGTTDGGASWTTIATGTGARIAFCFLTPSHAFMAIDSAVSRTTNGGGQWHPLMMTGVPVSEIHFLDQARGWMTGSNFVWRTTDGGSSWQMTVIPPMTSGAPALQSVSFVDHNVGWVAGSVSGPNHLSGHILYSTDGGATWSTQLSIGGTFFGYDIFTSLKPLNRDTCLATSSAGRVYKSTDGGVVWSNPATVSGLQSLTSVTPGTLLGTGRYGLTLRSTNLGEDWNATSSGYILTLSDLGDMVVLDSLHAFATGRKTVLKTTNGGSTWTPSAFTQVSGYIVSRKIVFTTPQTGWIAADYLGGWGGLFKTTDGGLTWTSQIDTMPRIFEMSFYDQERGWFASLGNIHATTDGGETWVSRGSTPQQEIQRIRFTSPTTGWAGGNAGLFRTADGGFNWVEIQPSGIRLAIRDIVFTNDQHGWVLGQGRFFRTSDGGSTWEEQSLPGSITFNSLTFVDQTRGWIVGFGGEVFNTTDGGATWNQEPSRTSHSLIRIAHATNGSLWAFGTGGTILKRGFSTTSAIKSRHRQPPQFALRQNYPNPFNPTTTIQYSLSSQERDGVRSHVTLKVFDVLGREVATLVDEVKEPGEHSVQFNAGDLSSGVYFYRLTAGGFSDVKKLIVMR